MSLNDSPPIPENHSTSENAELVTKKLPVSHVRWMIRRDMPEVFHIEQESYDFPWTEEDFLRCLRQRNSNAMIAELDEKILGFMLFELHKTRLHILNMTVHPEYRRKDIGTDMVHRLQKKLSSHRRTSITHEIRETNLPGQLFLRTSGFRAQRVVREFYEDTGEDAYLMQYKWFEEDEAPESK